MGEAEVVRVCNFLFESLDQHVMILSSCSSEHREERTISQSCRTQSSGESSSSHSDKKPVTLSASSYTERQSSTI